MSYESTPPDSMNYVESVRRAGHIRSDWDEALVMQQRKVRAHGLTPVLDVTPAVAKLRQSHGKKARPSICVECGYRIAKPGHLNGTHHKHPRKDR